MSDLRELNKIESSIKELQEKSSAIRDKIKNEAIAQAKKIISDNNLIANDLFDIATSGKTAKVKKVKSMPEPYYANPSNSSETCPKMGRKPGWYKDAISDGTKSEDMVIHK